MEDALAPQNRLAAAFIGVIATETAKGITKLPSYPEAAMRVQRALSAEEVDAEAVVRAVGAEQVLSLRVMQMANSILLNPLGRKVQDLRTAVGRVGYNMVRTAAVAFLMQQLRSAESLRDLKPRLTQLWDRSVRTAALAHVIARRVPRVNADVALLAGVLQSVGELYLLTRFRDYPALEAHAETRQRILQDWQWTVCRSVLDNWSVARSIGDAVQVHADLGRELRGPADLGDVLSVAKLLAELPFWEDPDAASPDALQAVAQIAAPFIARLGLQDDDLSSLLAESAHEVSALQSVLAD